MLMSQAYRLHPLAAALPAAVEAAPVHSTTPSRSFRRKLWITLSVIALVALAGAVVFGVGRKSRDDAALLSAPANAAPSSAAPASPVGPAIAVAAPAAPEPERITSTGISEADVAPPSMPQRAMDATTTSALPTAEPTQSTSTLKEPRKASPERASRNDRRSAPRRVGFTDAHAAQTTKTKKAATVAQTQNAPAPAKDPNCNVFLPDNVFMSHHDQFRCFR